MNAQRFTPTFLALLLLVTFAIGLVLLATFQARVSNYWPLGVDIYSHWAGARAFWNGASPYSETVTREAEFLVYGRARREGEAPFPFTYPAYLALVLFPITLLPAAQVGLVWGAAMWAILATLAAVWSMVLMPRPPPWLWTLLVVGILFYRPALVSVINGQYALFIVACIFGAWWLIARVADAWVGIPLVLATVKPSVGILVPLVVLLWAMRWRRWKIVASFVVVMVLMLIMTIARIGWWFPDMAYHTLTYSAMRQGDGLAWSAEQLVQPAGMVWLVLVLAVTGIGLYKVWREKNFPWLLLIGALNLNLLLTPHSVEYDLTMLLIPVLWLGWEWQRMRAGLVAVVLLLWLPWLSWLAMMLSGFEIDVWWRAIWMVYPSALLAVILWWWLKMRREQTA